MVCVFTVLEMLTLTTVLSNEEYDLDRDKTEGSPDGSTTGRYANVGEDPLFGICFWDGLVKMYPHL